MALTIGTNVGFVSVAPTTDPTGSSTNTMDGTSRVSKFTSPSGAIKIIEMGWWCNTASEAANFQVGLYAANGATVPGEAGTRLYTSGDVAKGTSGGVWKVATGLNWTITPNTDYWLGVQLDDVTTTTTIDSASSGGAGVDSRASQTALTNPYGGGNLTDEDGMIAIYAVYQTAPTVALSSPADSATGVSTTPDLVFTGTDGNSDDVRYEVQVATNSAFYKTITVGTSYNGQITDGTPSVTVSTLSTTSKFIAFAGNHQGTITAVTLNGTNLTKMATAATGFNETAEIWYIDNPGALTNVTLTGTFSGGSGRSLSGICLEGTATGVEAVEATNTGSNSSPTVNITPTVDGSIVLASAYAEDNFTQGAGETNISILESDTYECAAASYDIQTTIETQAMNFSIGSGQRWAIAAVAISPESYIVLDKVSGTDAGFSGSPDNSDPFTSGQAVTYTVQDALDESTTYYWRVRAIDPSGSNTYGAWATTRSFTTTAGGGTVVKDIIGAGFIPFSR